MKSWRETALVFDEMARLKKAGRACALATLTRVEGSSYRQPGARLLIRDDGSILGNVSGGCLEEDLRERAKKVVAAGQPEVVHYDTGSDENTIWGLGLGCNGKIDIYLQPAPVEHLDEIRAKLAGSEPFALVAGDFVETLAPPPDLVIAGAGDDAIPLVRLAVDAGFRVTLVDHRKAYLRRKLFRGAKLVCARAESKTKQIPATAQTLVVIKYHHLEHDKAWYQRFANAPVRYIGLLGPKARRDEILKASTINHQPFLYGPTGLDLGADGPEQIAVSIVAELLAVVATREPRHLRDRAKPIHE
ncbi:MAG TPA: XdhC family protein [Kiritimatiellia bacterium]|jgi:xanthine/CO dehydrogenase XdhC/CoxF family maturation factor